MNACYHLRPLFLTLALAFMAYAGYTQQPLPSPYSISTLMSSARTWTAKRPMTAETDIISTSRTPQEVDQTTEYRDGFGRPLQTVIKKNSPAGSDMVSAHTYDTLGREQFQYLPFTANTATTGDVPSDGNFKSDAFQEQAAFFNAYLTGQPGETGAGDAANWAYGHANFEPSPLNRILNSFSPGVNWVGSAAGSTPHNAQQKYLVSSTADSIRVWNIGAWTLATPELNTIPTSTTTYSAGQLYKTIFIDEQGHQGITYTDKDGHLVLKKAQLTAAADNGSGSGYTGWLCTYYVYDDHGNVRFVISPNLVTQMATTGSWTISQQQADELCYRFEYDQLDRLQIRKSPGTPTDSLGEVWMVYDERNRMVMQQDGNLRAQHKWQYVQYDSLDRPTLSGLITDNTYYANLSYHVSGASASITWPVLSSYTNEILSQAFYDNYNNIPSPLPKVIDATTNGTGNTAFSGSTNTAPYYSQPLVQSTMTQGLTTGTSLKVLGSSSQYLSAVRFYDETGRIIQYQTTNVTTGKDILTAQYDWSGKVLYTLNAHQYTSTSNPQTHLVTTILTYDAAGRPLSVKKSVASVINGVAVSSASATVVANTYDEAGNLKTKTLGNSLETLNYEYNVRGWLLGINRSYLTGSSSHYFGLELGYDNPTSVTGTSYLNVAYTGNTSGTIWKSKGDGINRKYDFSYDNSSRLTAAAFLQNTSGTTWDKSFVDFSVTGPNAGLISYDANGNISGLYQNGFAQGGSKPIDQLTYNYIGGLGKSNRLSYVNDAVNVAGSTLGDLHYRNAKTGASIDYVYDNNANPVTDTNRSITHIAYYPSQNLPDSILTPKGMIQYVYDAAGNKLRKIVTENGVHIASMVVNGTLVTNQTATVATTTTYADGFVYKTIAYSNCAALQPLNGNVANTDVLQFTGSEEGRIRFIPAQGTVPATFVHDYLIMDQLGNVRVGLTDQTQQDIYPAATGETTSVTVDGSAGTAQAYEAQYFNFNTSDWISSSTLPWYSAMTGSNYENQNGSGTPTNTVDPYSQVTTASAKVFQLCGNTASNPTGDNFGLGITLKVMAGDQINIYGTSFWHNSGSLPAGSYPVASVISSLLSSFGTSSAVTAASGHMVLDGSIFNTGTGTPTATLLSPLLPTNNAQTGYPNTPYAGINWIIFDDQFKPVSVGFDPVSVTTDNIKNHTPGVVTIPKNGYIYVYVSNQSNINVYFDNLQVVHTRGNFLEETHYYPTGLTMAGISDRAWNKTPNYFHFQGKEIQDQEWSDGSGLEDYDFGARTYDPQLGRWNTQDPAGQFASPYLGMGNNWMNSIDPTGKNVWTVFKDIGAIVGVAAIAYFTGIDVLDFSSLGSWFFAGGVAAAGYASASLESHTWDAFHWNGNAWKAAIAGELIATAAVVGADALAGLPTVTTTASGVTTTSISPDAATAFNVSKSIGSSVLSEITTNIGATTNTGQKKGLWNWDQLFEGTIGAAISGFLSSPEIVDDIDKHNGVFTISSTSLFSGDISAATGSVLSTGIKDLDSKGTFWYKNDQWFSLGEKLITKTESNLAKKAPFFKKKLTGMIPAYLSTITNRIGANIQANETTKTDWYKYLIPWKKDLYQQLPGLIYGAFTPMPSAKKVPFPVSVEDLMLDGSAW